MERLGNILHYLAIEGVAETETVAADNDLPESESLDVLVDLEERGLVEGEGFWYLTDEGEAHLDDLLRQRFTSDELDELANQYETFESLDLEFKDLANGWQQTDAEADRDELITELSAFHRDVREFFAAFPDSIRVEYEPYLADLEAALNALEDGAEEYYTGTEVESYHTVWFQLHDDLLRTLDEQRKE